MKRCTRKARHWNSWRQPFSWLQKPQKVTWTFSCLRHLSKEAEEKLSFKKKKKTQDFHRVEEKGGSPFLQLLLLLIQRIFLPSSSRVSFNLVVVSKMTVTPTVVLCWRHKFMSNNTVYCVLASNIFWICANRMVKKFVVFVPAKFAL